jgi:hypothetical protein
MNTLAIVQEHQEIVLVSHAQELLGITQESRLIAQATQVITREMGIPATLLIVLEMLTLETLVQGISALEATIMEVEVVNSGARFK